MAMTLPRGKATDGIAIVTFLAFLLAELSGQAFRLYVAAGFIPARVHALDAQHILLNMNWLPVWLTPLTATLVHGGWLHVILNLVIFVFCGRLVEHVLGPMRLLILYIAGAYAAAFAHWLADPASLEPMIGASGAISAVIGTYALLYSRREVKAIGPFSSNLVRIAWLAAGWTFLQLLIGLAGLSFGPMGGIAIWAHVGGFLAGLLLARPLLSQRFNAG